MNRKNQKILKNRDIKANYDFLKVNCCTVFAIYPEIRKIQRYPLNNNQKN